MIKKVLLVEAIVVTVNISMGTGWATVEMRGAALHTNLPKNAPRPNAVEACSMSKTRAFAAIEIRSAPLTPKRHMRKKIGKATESV